jgi:flagellar assembly protein FliH
MGYPRYRFDVRFDAAFSAEPAEPTVEEAEPDPLDQPVHSERDLQAALATAEQRAFAGGLEQGRREGDQAAAKRIEAELTAVLKRLDSLLEARADGFDATLQAVEAQGVAVIAALVRRIAPHLLQRLADDEILRLVGEALRAAAGAPLLRLRLCPPLASALGDQLAAQAAASGFRGRLEIFPDEAMAPGALDASWGTGSLSFDPAAIEAAITGFAERAMAALAPIAHPPAAELPAADTLNDMEMDEN